MKLLKLIPSAIRRYWLTIVGSMILVLAWYREKITISQHIENITYLKEGRKEYREVMLQRLVNGLLSDITLYMHNTSGNKFYLKALIDAYSAELRTFETLRANGQILRSNFKDLKLQDSLNRNFYARQEEISVLYKSGNFDAVNERLKKERGELLDLSKKDQEIIHNSLIDEKNAIDDIQFWTLFLYALGILMITMDKVKDALNNDSNELRKLLADVKEQNKKLLHRRDKEENKAGG